MPAPNLDSALAFRCIAPWEVTRHANLTYWTKQVNVQQSRLMWPTQQNKQRLPNIIADQKDTKRHLTLLPLVCSTCRHCPRGTEQSGFSNGSVLHLEHNLLFWGERLQLELRKPSAEGITDVGHLVTELDLSGLYSTTTYPNSLKNFFTQNLYRTAKCLTMRDGLCSIG